MAQEVTRIKKRIKSVTGSYKITSAMKLVSTVKLKKWKNKMLATKEYSKRIDEIAKMVFSSVEESNNPFFVTNDKADKNLYIILSSSLGLCGAYNNNIFRLADAKIKENDEAIILGNKAISHYKNGAFKQIEDFKEYSSVRDEAIIKSIVNFISKEYTKGTYKEVHLIYTAYKNSLVFHPCDYTVLPLKGSEPIKGYPPLMEPSKEALIDSLVPFYLKNSVYAKFLESEVCEQAARSNAMENATKNAEELLESLQIEFNKARQGAITQEITEIVGGSNM